MIIEGDDDLTAELDAALGGPVETPEQQEAPPAEGETPEQEQQRLYRRDGRRFVPNEQEEKQAPAEGEKPPVEAKPKAAWKPTWYKDEFGPWDTLAEPFRNALRDQERNAAQAIEKHSTAAKAWDPVSKLLEPHAQQLAAAGVSQQQYVSNLVNADAYLRAEPVKAMEWLCNSYLGCSIDDLAAWMQQQGIQPTKVDPLQQELASLKQQVSQLSQLPQQQARAAAEQQIQTWAKDKPDFAAVRQTMAAFAKQNPQASLDELYEQAQWAHPEIRERILQDREDKRVKELQGKRQAGAQSPRGGQPNGLAKPIHKTMSLEDEIAMHLDGGV